MKNRLNLKGIPLLRKKKKTQISKYNIDESTCLNCNTKLVGGFCHNCGQKHIDIKKPFPQIVSTIIDSLFSLDNKLVKTLPALFFKPGFLSKEFTTGKRVRYTAPFKLFMFSSILFFFLLGITETEQTIDIKTEVEKSVVENQQSKTLPNDKAEETYDDESAFNEAIDDIMQNPSEYRAKVYKALSYMFFILMPLFALLLKVLTRKKKRVYIEHLVHSVHIHTFGFCIGSMLLTLDLIFNKSYPIANYGFFIALIFYLVVSIKQFYKASWVYSLWKSVLLLSIYSVFFIAIMVSSIVVAILV
jgi:hypothetical protein